MTAATPLVELSAATRLVLSRIQSVGRPLLVGGTVRDALLAREQGLPASAKDVDIEVHGVTDFDVVAAALEGAGRPELQGRAFGVLALTIDGETFDISISQSTLDDAFARRDFTVNAIGWDPQSGELIDPYGGQADLSKRLLRPVGETFADDPLRVLRGVQFVARFGLAPTAEYIAAARDLRSRFSELPRERVWGEWRKLARLGVRISDALAALDRSGWLPHFPELAALRGVEQDPTWHPEGDVLTHVGLAADQAAAASDRLGLDPEDREAAVFAALTHDFGKPAHSQLTRGRITSYGHAEGGVEPTRRFLNAIGAPAHLVSRVLPLVREHMAHASVSGAPSVPAVRRLMRRLGTATIHEWARLVDADSAGRGSGAKASPASAWLRVAERIGPTATAPLLTGAHLIAAGLTPGPEFKQLLRDALEAQDAGTFDDEMGAVEWFRAARTSNPGN